MDDVDALVIRDEILLNAMIQVRKQEGPKPTGYCYFCDEPVNPPMRWCDATCRDLAEAPKKHYRQR